jgi:hypothetical protein
VNVAEAVLRVILIALPHATDLGRSLLFRFWNDNFGPLPPDLDAWAEIDRAADARARATEPDLEQHVSKR